MEKKTETAIDTIFAQSAKIDKLEMTVRLLDDKLNMILRILENPERKMKEKVFMKGEIFGSTENKIKTYPEAVEVEEVDDSEVMEVKSIAPSAPKQAIISRPEVKPVSLPITKPEVKAEPLVLDASVVDPLGSNTVEKIEKVTCIVRGKYDSRHGNISNVAVTVKNHAGKQIKATKTNATGDWLVLLPAGEYGVEFARIGQTPIIRTISIMPGKKEMEILI